MAVSIDLAGKVALITGGAAGIGRATAALFAEAGASVVIADVDEAGAQAAVADIGSRGGGVSFVKADVSRVEDVRRMTDMVIQRHGRLDCAINNAAIDIENVPLADCDDALFDRVIGLNLRGVFLCMKYQIRQMLAQGNGTIVNLGSVNAVRAQTHGAAYTASKLGLDGLTQSAAAAYGRDGIRINTVQPGCIDTPMMQDKLDRLDMERAVFEPSSSQVGRYGTAAEVAQAILWLCSDQASFAIGGTLLVDGGYLL